jgi:hypothetical protein
MVSSLDPVEEAQMPVEAAVFVTLIVVAFIALGVTLAWAHVRTTR